MEEKDFVLGKTYYSIEYSPEDLFDVHYVSGYKWAEYREDGNFYDTLAQAENELMSIYNTYPKDFFGNAHLKIHESKYTTYKDEDTGKEEEWLRHIFTYIRPVPKELPVFVAPENDIENEVAD